MEASSTSEHQYKKLQWGLESVQYEFDPLFANNVPL